jgi:hypothetical protein
MNVPKDAMLLRIFFGEEDRFEGNPLHEAIVRKAREMHVAGATVFRGPMGFGHSSRLHNGGASSMPRRGRRRIQVNDAERRAKASAKTREWSAPVNFRDDSILPTPTTGIQMQVTVSPFTLPAALGYRRAPTGAALSSATRTVRRWLTCISRPSPEGERLRTCSRVMRRGG